MVKELSLFPLNVVCYPGEILNLHIFEPRYKLLINECLANEKTFGIPAYVNNKLELGTEVEIIDVVKIYDDGRMDISVLGLAVFLVVIFRNPVQDKLYSSGSVRVKMIDLAVNEDKVEQILDLADEFFLKIRVTNPFQRAKSYNSYSFAHKIGLSIDEEYLLLGMMEESQRLDFIIAHLMKTTPRIQEIERTKKIIAMNGHFKKFDALDF
ncbi:MAG: LON peptidase substrate-binding domain-containing protein [Bacteroidetes bacterium]|nr:LON peptidase substrate-binding domain-containing protein [Bacteroidota bacterium]MDA1118906.1 LON peptidase substrate-binding domain-containing protein [Bacteroidota bacterium]